MLAQLNQFVYLPQFCFTGHIYDHSDRCEPFGEEKRKLNQMMCADHNLLVGCYIVSFPTLPMGNQTLTGSPSDFGSGLGTLTKPDYVL